MAPRGVMSMLAAGAGVGRDEPLTSPTSQWRSVTGPLGPMSCLTSHVGIALISSSLDDDSPLQKGARHIRDAEKTAIPSNSGPVLSRDFIAATPQSKKQQSTSAWRLALDGARFSNDFQV